MGFFLAGLVLAVPLSIFANLLTPWIQRKWAQSSEDRKAKRIVKLQAELARLLYGKGNQLSLKKVSSKTFSKQPQIVSAASFATVSWEDVTVYQIAFRNSEIRYPTTAHSLTASINYIPFHGEQVALRDATWAITTKAANTRTYCSDVATLGMLDEASVIVLAARDNYFYLPEYHDTDGRYGELCVKTLEPLSYGEWTVVINLDGDNFSGTYKFKMSIFPNGSVSWAPVN